MGYESELQKKDKQSSSNDVAQGKSNRSGTLQLVDNRPEAGRLRNFHALADNRHSAQQARQLKSMADNRPVQKKENKTGLPDSLKSGIESLSGMSMDHVKVHYNSSQPAQLNAHAFAQGSDIHVASGQEQHLPHEAWHVVQQAQGRVKPTVQMKIGGALNDDHGLEQEADAMGNKALQLQASGALSHSHALALPVLQLKTSIINTQQTLEGKRSAKDKSKNPQVAGKKMEAKLDPNYPVKGSTPGNGDEYAMYPLLNAKWNETYIKGHMLNANLGGLGIPANLFPITSTANKSHLTNVELHVKQALLELNERVSDNHKLFGSYVHYTVEAKSKEPKNFIRNPNAELECNAEKVITSPGIANVVEPIVTYVVSSSRGTSDETFNERLEELGYGSSGSGKRSGSEAIKTVDNRASGGTFHVEFAADGSYQQWQYKKKKWSLVKSDEQTPNTIAE